MGFETFSGAQDDGECERSVQAANCPAPVILSASARVEVANRPAKDLASATGRDEFGDGDRGASDWTARPRVAISTLTKAGSFATHGMGFEMFSGAQDDGECDRSRRVWGDGDRGASDWTARSRVAISTLTKARSFATHGMGFETFSGAQDDGECERSVQAANCPAPVILSASARVEVANRPAKDLASATGRDEFGEMVIEERRIGPRVRVSPSRP